MIEREQCVEVPLFTDAWMRGDRYGTVVSVGTKFFRVLMDRSGRVLRFRVSLAEHFRVIEQKESEQ